MVRGRRKREREGRFKREETEEKKAGDDGVFLCVQHIILQLMF